MKCVSLLIPLSAYKLPPLTLAILCLLSLIAFMLLVCLLSCLYKIHKRNEKSKRLMLLAQQSGKGDGDAFRQVTATCTAPPPAFVLLDVVGSES